MSRVAAEQNAAEFSAMLAAAKAGPKCKQLALSELPKYVGRYPDMADQALDILTDLFEEKEEFQVKSIAGFKVIASTASGGVIKKLVGIVGQILQSDVEAVAASGHEALVAALERDVTATMEGLLEPLCSTLEPAARSQTLVFIEKALLPRAGRLLNKNPEAQTTVAEQLKKVMGNSVSTKEFSIFMRVLFSMNKFKNGIEGANEILDFVHASIDLDKDFSASAEDVDKLIMCTGSARIIYQHGASPDKLVRYLSSKVLPKFKELGPEHQLKLLKLLADIAPFVKGAPCRSCLPLVWPLALSEVPDIITEETKINWAALECLLYTFHHLAERVPGFLHGLTGLQIFNGQPENRQDEDHSAKLAELKAKMTTLVTHTSEYAKKLKLVMNKLRENKLDTPEAKKENGQRIASCLATIAACQNVSIMADKILKINLKNPEFLADAKAVTLSFKGGGAAAGGKRGRDGGGGGGGGGQQPGAKIARGGGNAPRGGIRGGRGGMRGRGGRR